MVQSIAGMFYAMNDVISQTLSVLLALAERQLGRLRGWCTDGHAWMDAGGNEQCR